AALGLPFMGPERGRAKLPPPSPGALEAALATIRRRAPVVALVGVAAAVVLVWLMAYRPGS
ncbi:MAG TPA: hypothetical protein VHH36_05190, partial [Candidatus Thermoplasmatota archaeon]|nr:hypothetical protein [Candidatus Thermoplasmatota archaeon]